MRRFYVKNLFELIEKQQEIVTKLVFIQMKLLKYNKKFI